MAKSKGRGRSEKSKLGIMGYGGYSSKGMQFDEETETYSPMGLGFGTQYGDLDEEYADPKEVPEPTVERFGRPHKGRRMRRSDHEDD